MKRIIIVIVGLMTCFGGVVGYGQENLHDEAKKEIGSVTWIDEHLKAFKKGDLRNFTDVARQIFEHKVDEIIFDRLLMIVKDKNESIRFRCLAMELLCYFKDEKTSTELKSIAENKNEMIEIRTYAIQQMAGAAKDEKIFKYLIQTH